MLIAGTSIGAGMLGLPIKTYSIGFIPSLIAMIFIWSIMLASAFFMLEATLTQPKGSNLATMANSAYGNSGQWLITILYLGFLYALNAAYIDSLHKIILSYFSTTLTGNLISLILFISFLIFVSCGLKQIAHINKILVLFLGAIYILAMLQLSNDVSASKLTYVGKGFLEPLAIMVTAFGYQIIIPSICEYCNYDATTIKKSIWVGSSIPLITYIIWQTCTLGVLPIETTSGLATISSSNNPVVLLTNSLKEHAYLINFQALIQYFTTLAVATSFIGVSISLFDFCKDSIKKQKSKMSTVILLIFTFLPSLISTLYFPNIFIKALEYAGVLVALLLGALPAILAIKLRAKTSNTWQMPYSKICLVWITCGILIVLINPLHNLFS